MSAPRMSGRRRTPALWAAVALSATVLLSACGGSASSGTSSGASEPVAGGGAAYDSAGGAAPGAASAAAPAAAASAGAQAAGSANSGVAESGAKTSTTTVTSGSNAAAQTRQRLIRNAEITLEVKDLAVAAARVRQAALNVGGVVSSEVTGYSAAAKSVTGTDANGQPVERAAVPGQSVIIMRVPEPDLDKAINGLTGVGKEVSRTQSSQDVTGDIADVTSRVATQRASVERVRALLAQAKTLQEIVLLESELTRRESDLEALEGRLASLSDRADMSTLTVVLQTPEVAPAVPVEPNGFVKGLQSGWDAVVQSTTVVLTVLGALLPIAVVLAVIAWPALWLGRRLRRNRPAPMPAAPTVWSGQGPLPQERQPVLVGAGAPAPTPSAGPGAAGSGSPATPDAGAPTP